LFLIDFCANNNNSYLIHWPGVSGLRADHLDNKKYRHSTWKAFVSLHKAGLIKSIGVSNYLVKHLQEFVSDCNGVVPAVNQVEWHPRHKDEELLKYCRANGIFLQAYSSLGSSNSASLRHDATVIRIGEALHKSPTQILLRWALQHEIGVLPKASSREHIVENIDLDFRIPDEDMQALDSFAKKEKFAWDPAVVD